MPSFWDSLRLPETPLLAAGALGGPFVIASLTPLRNAMSNGAQDSSASLQQLYTRALGFHSPGVSKVRIAYTGALVSSGPACIQWTIIGPAFHLFNSFAPSPAALLATAALETCVTFGSQSRNAQMAFNVQVQAQGKAPLPLFGIVRPWGPGATFFMLRNFCGMSGIRLLSPSVQKLLEPVLPSGPRELASDLVASMMTCVVSAPLNHCWTYTVTTPKLWTASTQDRCSELASYLRQQYLLPSDGAIGLRFTPLVRRDFAARCIYIASVFTMFSGIERLAMAYWPA